MAQWSQRAQRSRWPPNAAVRQRARARSTRRCWLVSQAPCVSMKRSPCCRMMSATSKGGRVTASAIDATGAPCPAPTPASRPTGSRPRADVDARGEDRGRCVQVSHGRAAVGSCASRHPLPADASRTNGAGDALKHVCQSSPASQPKIDKRSEEHTSELQSRQYLVCRLLLEKKKKKQKKKPVT